MWSWFSGEHIWYSWRKLKAYPAEFGFKAYYWTVLKPKHWWLSERLQYSIADALELLQSCTKKLIYFTVESRDHLVCRSVYIRDLNFEDNNPNMSVLVIKYHVYQAQLVANFSNFLYTLNLALHRICPHTNHHSWENQGKLPLISKGWTFCRKWCRYQMDTILRIKFFDDFIEWKLLIFKSNGIEIGLLRCDKQ